MIFKQRNMKNVINNYDFFSHVIVLHYYKSKSLRNDKPILSSSWKVPACKISRFKKQCKSCFFFSHFSYLLQIVPALARADYQARMMFRGDFLTLCRHFLPFHATTQLHLVRFVLKTRSITVVVTKRKKKKLIGKTRKKNNRKIVAIKSRTIDI